MIEEEEANLAEEPHVLRRRSFKIITGVYATRGFSELNDC